MTLGKIYTLREARTVEELLKLPAQEWLIPDEWHPTDGLECSENLEIFIFSTNTEGRRVIKPKGIRAPSHIVVPYIYALLREAMIIWQKSNDVENKPTGFAGLVQFFGSWLGLQFPAQAPLPKPNFAFDLILSLQKAERADLEAAQKVELTSLPIKRTIAFNEARAAEIPVGSVPWKTLQVRWDNLKATTIERHKAEMAKLLQKQKAQRGGIVPQWKAKSLARRESLLRAHLIVFEALVALPEILRSKLMPELRLDPLDSDESLLRAFHRRRDTIKKAADSMKMESSPIQ